MDLKLYNGIRSGKAGTFSTANRHTVQEALAVVDYMLSRISENRVKDMWHEIYTATSRLYQKTPVIRAIIESLTGIILPKV